MVKKPAEVSADALEDDLEYEVGSDAAGESVSDGGSDSEAGSGSYAHDIDSGTESGYKPAIGKVKKQLTTEEKREKRKAKRAVSKKRKREELGFDKEDGTDGEPTKKSKAEVLSKIPLGPEQQSDFLAKLFLDHNPGLTSVELLDKTPPLKAVRDTSDTAAEARSTDKMCAYLERYTARKELHSANKEPGTPHTLVLCASAIRVADVVRPLKTAYKPAVPDQRPGGKQQQPKKQKNAIEIVKLFGKEKLKDQATMLSTTRVSIAVGVPGRVAALLAPADGEAEDGSLKVRQLEQIILDASYLDSKKRGLLQIKEVCRDLATVLGGGDEGGARKIRQRLRDGQTQILFF
jgi:protein CMS1